MEELWERHKKEQRDLQSRITQKKKQASKKTRKAVNDECARLEAELKERQAKETAELNGEVVADDHFPVDQQLEDLTLQVDGDHDDAERDLPPVEPPSTFVSSAADAPPKKRNRQRDRLARRAAEQESQRQAAELEAASLPDLKAQERTRMLEAMRSRGLHEVEIRADGHCLYSAVADQLRELAAGPRLEHRAVRAAAADYIAAHPQDFLPFLEEPLDEYVRKVRDTGEWGGQLELLALARTFGRHINVLQDFGRVERIEAEGSDEKADREAEEMWLGYYKHGFGLGEHYNSLRRTKTTSA